MVLLILTSCVKVSSQQKVICDINLKTVIPIDLSIGADKSDIIKYLDNSVQLKGDDLKYTPKDIDIYNGSKKITLPNGYDSNAKFHLRFREEKLVGYKVFIEIGPDHKYFWELLKNINESDKKNFNKFIDLQEKKPSYRDIFNDRDCKRMISVERSLEKKDIFEMKVAVN